MGFSNYALEQMGFRRLREAEVLSASFSSVHAFEIQGISLSIEQIVAESGNIGGVHYRLAIADTLNLAAKTLVDDDFVEDETGWTAEHKCAPPYLLLHIGPTPTHLMTGQFLKEESDSLRTYDGFIPARRELREMEAKVIPSLITALSCTFGTLPNTVKFQELDHVVQGVSVDGVPVYDFGVSMRADLRVGQAVSANEFTALLASATYLATRINAKVAHFYHLALQEDDPLKRFLFLFFTIERQTNATFKSIYQGASTAGLAERFYWCSRTVWTHMTPEDVANFGEVKKVRNQIAHGEIAQPPIVAVALVEKVAAKLQLASHGGDS